MATIIHVMGRLGKDPETRVTASGQKVTSFSVASNTRRQGEDHTVWYRVTVFGERLDKMMSFLKKGSGVHVVGTFDARTYQDKEGKTQVSLEVIAEHISFLPSGERAERAQAPQDDSYGAAPQQQYQQAAFQPRQTVTAGAQPQQSMDEDDDLPF